VPRLLSILLWSVIAAAFIGPGTVTTCAAAGASHGTALVWALLFSTFGCLVLQEAAARVTVVSGSTLAEALGGASRDGARRLISLALVGGAIVVGCAAYEAGNILGAVAGASLGNDLSPRWLTVILGAIAFAVL
jgi:Mn2+/Fe2+ NRAMP family transporter